MLIALASGKGAPGVSVAATALAVVWPRPVLLVEADPRGGTVMWGLGQGRSFGGRGLLGYEMSSRRMPLLDAMRAQIVQLDNDWPDTFVLPGLDQSRQATTVSWSELGTFLAGQDQWDVIADCGSLPAARPPSGVWGTADLTVLVTRSSMAAAHFAEDAALLLRADLQATGLGVDRLVSVVVGPGQPYPVSDMGRFLGEVAPVEGTLAWDPPVAAMISEGDQTGRRRLRRSPLLRSAGSLAQRLGGLALMNRNDAVWAPSAAEAPAATPSTSPPPVDARDAERSTSANPLAGRRGVPFQAPRAAPPRPPSHPTTPEVNHHA